MTAMPINEDFFIQKISRCCIWAKIEKGELKASINQKIMNLAVNILSDDLKKRTIFVFFSKIYKILFPTCGINRTIVKLLKLVNKKY